MGEKEFLHFTYNIKVYSQNKKVIYIECTFCLFYNQYLSEPHVIKKKSILSSWDNRIPLGLVPEILGDVQIEGRGGGDNVRSKK